MAKANAVGEIFKCDICGNNEVCISGRTELCFHKDLS